MLQILGCMTANEKSPIMDQESNIKLKSPLSNNHLVISNIKKHPCNMIKIKLFSYCNERNVVQVVQLLCNV